MTAAIGDFRTIAGLQAALALTRAELEATRAELAATRQSALTDPLTGLSNRSALNTALAEYAAGPDSVAVVMVDLDGFKPVNDRYGHAAGDEVLTTVADRLRSVLVTDGAVVARLGGDEFALVAPSPAPAMAWLLAVDVHRAVTRPVEICGGQVTVGASVGVVHAAPAEVDWALGAADQAMYRAKAAGGGVSEHDLLTALPVVEPRPALRTRDLLPGLRRSVPEAVAA